MKTNYQNQSQKAKRLGERLQAIQAKHPGVDLFKIKTDAVEFYELSIKLLMEKIDNEKKNE